MQLPKTHVLTCLKEHRTSPRVLGAGRAVTARQELWDDRDEEHIGRGMHSWMEGWRGRWSEVPAISCMEVLLMKLFQM